MVLFAIFIVRLLSPVAAIISVLAAYLSRGKPTGTRWLWAVVAAIAGSALDNIFLCSTQALCREPFGPYMMDGFLIGIVAALVWYWVASVAIRWWSSRKQSG